MTKKKNGDKIIVLLVELILLYKLMNYLLGERQRNIEKGISPTDCADEDMKTS